MVGKRIFYIIGMMGGLLILVFLGFSYRSFDPHSGTFIRAISFWILLFTVSYFLLFTAVVALIAAWISYKKRKNVII